MKPTNAPLSTLFFLYLLAILAFSCNKKEAEVLPAEENFTLTISESMINLWGYEAIVLSNQYGEARLEMVLDTVAFSGSLELEVEKSPEEEIALTFIREDVSNIAPEERSFLNETYVNVQNGAEFRLNEEEAAYTDDNSYPLLVHMDGVQSVEDIILGALFFYDPGGDVYYELDTFLPQTLQPDATLRIFPRWIFSRERAFGTGLFTREDAFEF